MSIKRKVHLALLTSVIGLFVISGGVYYSLQELNKMDSKVISFVETENLGKQITNKMDSVQINKMYFLTYKQMKYAHRAEEEMKELSSLVNQLKSRAQNDEIKNNTELLLAYSDDYLLRFNQMVTAYREMGLSTSFGLIDEKSYHRNVNSTEKKMDDILIQIETDLANAVESIHLEKEKLMKTTSIILFSTCSVMVVLFIQLLTFSNRLEQEIKQRTEELHQSLVQLDKIAKYDQLTGLPNRYMLYEYVNQAIIHSKISKKGLAVMFLDLDQFKIVNDTMGHEVGDNLLKEVAKRLSDCIGQRGIVARQGGDEFVILLEDVDKDRITKVANRIIDRLVSPFYLKGKEFFTTTSIGISLYPNDGKDQESLFKNADKALYLVKESGKNNYQFYSYARDTLTRKMMLESGLRNAIANNELYLVYQPQFNLKTNQTFGMEALLRWNHPQFSKVPPAEFIPIAEKSGLIIPIGKWVLRTVSQQIVTWLKKGVPVNHVAINISAHQFKDINFIEDVKQIIQDSRLPTGYLELEITESLMQNMEESIFILNELKKLGFTISIDDFGTGYSSLSILHHLPVERVKIDRTFINNMLTSSKISSLVKTIIEMGHNLNFELVAEGIENKEQEEVLKDFKCHIGQGYLYSQPISAEEIEQLLK